MFVLPTSIVRSMPILLLLLHAHGFYHVAFGDRVPVSFGAPHPGVLSVQVGVSRERNEELARARVPTRERHADIERAEGHRRGLAAEEMTRPTIAVAAAIAELHDKTGNNPVNDDPRVEAGASERNEARCCDGSEHGVERNAQGACIGVEKDTRGS